MGSNPPTGILCSQTLVFTVRDFTLYRRTISKRKCQNWITQLDPLISLGEPNSPNTGLSQNGSLIGSLNGFWRAEFTEYKKRITDRIP